MEQETINMLTIFAITFFSICFGYIMGKIEAKKYQDLIKDINTNGGKKQ